jgi:hypothetical protein
MPNLLISCAIIRYARGIGSAALLRTLCMLLHLLCQLIEMMLQRQQLLSSLHSPALMQGINKRKKVMLH